MAFGKDGMIVAKTPEDRPLRERKGAKVARVKETGADQYAIVNAKLDALLRAQGISPEKVEEDA